MDAWPRCVLSINAGAQSLPFATDAVPFQILRDLAVPAVSSKSLKTLVRLLCHGTGQAIVPLSLGTSLVGVHPSRDFPHLNDHQIFFLAAHEEDSVINDPTNACVDECRSRSAAGAITFRMFGIPWSYTKRISGRSAPVIRADMSKSHENLSRIQDQQKFGEHFVRWFSSDSTNVKT